MLFNDPVLMPGLIKHFLSEVILCCYLEMFPVRTSVIPGPAINITTALSLQPSVTPPADIDYILTVKSNAGCGIAADTMHVFVYKDVLVPTAFTPNGDGVNDTWHIPALSGLSTFEVSVFNRYGEIVFQTKNANLPWDGKFKGTPQATGVYVYFINLIQQGRILKGTLLILR